MILPIDASAAPYREKYLTSETTVLNRWCVQGEGDVVDIIDGTDDIFTRVPVGMAHRLVAARDFFCSAVELELALHDTSPRMKAQDVLAILRDFLNPTPKKP